MHDTYLMTDTVVYTDNALKQLENVWNFGRVLQGHNLPHAAKRGSATRQRYGVNFAWKMARMQVRQGWWWKTVMSVINLLLLYIRNYILKYNEAQLSLGLRNVP